MRESLRARLVGWYALVLVLVVGLYGGAVCYQSWRSMTASLDRELQGHARELAMALRPAPDGHFDLELPQEAGAYFRQDGGGPYYVIWSNAGALIDRSDPDVQPGGAPRPGRRQATAAGPRGATVLVGRDVGDLWQAQRALVLNVLIAGLMTLAAAIGAGWFVAGRALAPIRKISDAARRMAGGELEARITVEKTETELEQVGSVLNDAFDRLKLAVDQERRFTADASHELRTPISVLRAEVDWALDRDRTTDQLKDSLAVCRRAALRMHDAVERLLALARAEACDPAQQKTLVPLRPLLDEVVAWLQPVAQERGVKVKVTADPLELHGDPAQLREALNNVVSNAILYNKRGGSVVISTRTSASFVHIEVIDSGIGIPSGAVPHVFDRFFRVDKARSREMGGSGLGLSIARAIVAAHGGALACTSELGTGSVFVFSLPRDHALAEPRSTTVVARRS